MSFEFNSYSHLCAIESTKLHIQICSKFVITLRNDWKSSQEEVRGLIHVPVFNVVFWNVYAIHSPVFCIKLVCFKLSSHSLNTVMDCFNILLQRGVNLCKIKHCLSKISFKIHLINTSIDVESEGLFWWRKSVICFTSSKKVSLNIVDFHIWSFNWFSKFVDLLGFW